MRELASMVSTGTPAAISPASASLVRRSDRRSSSGAAVSAAAEKVLRHNMVLACVAPPLTREMWNWRALLQNV